MQVIRINTRPQAHRVYKTTAAAPRNMSLFAVPRFVQMQHEVAPLFSLVNELACATRPARSSYRQTFRSFTPKFSVRENETNYELNGELPGVESKDINIEFTSGNVLKVHGRTESRREEGTKQEAVQAAPAPAAVEAQPEPVPEVESETSSYHKASVEEEDAEFTMVGANPDAAQDTPAETPAESSTVASEAPQAPAETPKQQSKYYFSERSVGQFARSFTFPAGSINTEEVKASLKNGILSIVVPKAPRPADRRINIE
jgi:HSP20 family molecular chaperone IbpA